MLNIPHSKEYRSLGRIVLIILNACLSSFFFGYSIVYLSCLTFTDIASLYSFKETSTLQGILNGCIPVGAGCGALFSSILIARVSRRNFFLSVNVLSAVGLGIIQIRNLPCLLIGRIIQGFSVGLYSAIVPLYINQMVPPSLSGIGAINQAVIALSQAFAFLLAYLLQNTSQNVQWQALSLFLYITLVIQTLVLLFIFPYNTPKYLYSCGKGVEAVELIEILYSADHVPTAINKFELFSPKFNSQVTEKLNMESARESHQQQSNLLDDQAVQKTKQFEKFSLVGNENKIQFSCLAVMIAIQISLLQQLVGVNAVVTYGVTIFQDVLPGYNKIIPIIISGEPAVMAVATSFLLSKVGRKFLIQMGTIASIVTLCMCFIGFLIGSQKLVSQILIISGLIIYMAFFGLTLGPVVWLYIPEIVEPKIIPFSTMANWVGASFCIILFPIIQNSLLGGNPAYLFLFFMGCSLIGFVINFFFLVETKDKKRQAIYTQYAQLKFL